MARNRPPKKRKKDIGNALSIFIGAIFGIIIIKVIDTVETGDLTSVERLLLYVLSIGGAYIAILFHILVHESGHLLFGLLTGYRFLSFRIGSLMWMKEDRHLKMKRLSITGTGGQCLLVPPETSDG